MKNNIKNNQNIKSQIKNSKKTTKQQKTYDYSDLESSGNSCYFSDKSYECEISWEGINQSDNFKSNQEGNKKLNKDTKKIYSFDSSFYLEEENNNLPFNYDKNGKICAEYESEFSEFDFQAIGKIKKNKTINKKYALEEDYDFNDSENEINYVKSISRINKISEDFKDELTNKNNKNLNKINSKGSLNKETDDLKVHINDTEYK